MDLFLLAVDADSGRQRFGPKLAPTLALAELLDQVRDGRPAPESVADWLRTREPGRVDGYVNAAGKIGILDVTVRKDGYFEHKRIKVADRRALQEAVDRLLRILDAALSPREADLTFLVLASEVGRAQAHLRGLKNRERRRRLDELVGWVADHDRRQSVLQTVLREGLEAVREMTAHG